MLLAKQQNRSITLGASLPCSCNSLLDHTSAQIGIDQTAFSSIHCIAQCNNRNLFFSGEACEPRTFKNIHTRPPDLKSITQGVTKIKVEQK